MLTQDEREGLATGEYIIVPKKEYEYLLDFQQQAQSIAAHKALDDLIASQPGVEAGRVAVCTCVGTRSFTNSICDNCGGAITPAA